MAVVGGGVAVAVDGGVDFAAAEEDGDEGGA